MNKTLKMMLALMAGAVVFTACSSDDILAEPESNEVEEAPSLLKPMTFTAVQEGQGGTRAAIDGLDINWSDGDKICIFDGSSVNDGIQMFEIATGAGSTSATFTGSAADASAYYALYPGPRLITQAEAESAAGVASDLVSQWKKYYESASSVMKEYVFENYHITDQLNNAGVSEENKAIVYAYIKSENYLLSGLQLEGSSIKGVVIPAEQTATAGSANPTAMIMVAKSDDTKALEFKNVCAYVKVTPQFDCYAIYLTSNGSEQIAGKVTVNYNDGNPTTTVTADGTNCVSLVGSITAGNTYYIAVRPEALTSGFNIEFLTADKEYYYARSTDKTLALARSNVKNLGEFTTDGTWTIATPTFGDDGAGHSWKLLTPTFKLAIHYGAKAGFYDYTPWENWAYPEADELLAVADMGCITYDNEITPPRLHLHGAGILKYVKDAEVDLLPRYEPSFWTNTSSEERYGYKKYIVIGNPNCVDEIPDGYFLYALYKYNG